MLLKTKGQIAQLGLGLDSHKQGRNIIAEYGDFGSQAFAPLTKLGLFPDRCQQKYSVKSHFLNSYRGIRLQFFCLSVVAAYCAMDCPCPYEPILQMLHTGYSKVKN